MPTERPSSHNVQPKPMKAPEVDVPDLETVLRLSVPPLSG